MASFTASTFVGTALVVKSAQPKATRRNLAVEANTSGPKKARGRSRLPPRVTLAAAANRSLYRGLDFRPCLELRRDPDGPQSTAAARAKAS